MFCTIKVIDTLAYIYIIQRIKEYLQNVCLKHLFLVPQNLTITKQCENLNLLGCSYAKKTHFFFPKIYFPLLSYPPFKKMFANYLDI